MALDLFKRVETRKGLFAVEKITLIYNLLTSILILFLFQRMDHPWHMLLDRAMIAAMTFLLMYLYRLAPCKFSAFVRIVIQMSLLSYWYPDTFEFNRFFPNLDHVFATIEQFIFSGQPAIWFCHTFPHILVSEAFNMGYFFYYPMMLIVALFYFIYRFEWFEKMSFVLVTSLYIICFISLSLWQALSSIFRLSDLIMWLREFFLPSVTISIIIRSCCPDRDISTDSFIAW